MSVFYLKTDRDVTKVDAAWKSIPDIMLKEFHARSLEKHGLGNCDPQVLKLKLKNIKSAASAHKRRIPKSGSGSYIVFYLIKLMIEVT